MRVVAPMIFLVSMGMGAAIAQQQDTTFFITSVGPGKGADLGGLEGADAHCQSLAEAAGLGNRIWRAYLSTNARGGANAVNARDRIGTGPWQNAKGAVIATSVEDLHSGNNRIGREIALDEKGQPIKLRGDKPNQHDILTGSDKDGRAYPPNLDLTCSNWTSSGPGVAMLATPIARVTLLLKARKTSMRTWKQRVLGTQPTTPVAVANRTSSRPAATACSIASPRDVADRDAERPGVIRREVIA